MIHGHIIIGYYLVIYIYDTWAGAHDKEWGEIGQKGCN